MAKENKADAKAAAARRAENKALTRDADRRAQALNRSVVRGKPRGQKGGINAGVAFVLAGVGLFLWGFAHGGRTPDGRWILAVALVGLVVLLFGTGAVRYRRRERLDAEYTRRVEAGMQQDTSGAHHWDGV